jgi:hypothetical protein
MTLPPELRDLARELAAVEAQALQRRYKAWLAVAADAELDALIDALQTHDPAIARRAPFLRERSTEDFAHVSFPAAGEGSHP